MDAASPIPAALLDWERYEVVELLGEGGMGRVYRAIDRGLGRHVALKVLARGHAGRFTREARLMARVDHPHICKVFDTGTIGGEPYIAMQLIAGRTLADDDLGRDAAAVLGVMIDVADAVAAAHDVGLVHRDLKPSNIMLENGKAYVLDFGLAREVAGAGLTATGDLLGTPAFMAPEQARGGAVDARTDVYGLGATLFTLLTGRPPFEGSQAEVISAVLEREPPGPRKLAPGLSAELETVVLQCLAKDPARRYPTVAALANDLRRCRAGEPIRARRAGVGQRLGRRLRQQRAAVTVAAVALAAGGVALGLWLRQSGRAGQRAALAQRFGVEIERMRDGMRRAYGLPLHDVRPEKARVVARIAAVEKTVAELGDLAAGPGEAAIGRGYLSIEDWGRARQHLERAWELGARGPEVAYALSQALGKAYRVEMTGLARTAIASQREARRRAIETRLRDPALAYARLAAGSDEDPGYLEALVAYYEGRLDAALAGARNAAERRPWLYEAHLLEGEAHVARAYELAFHANDYAAGQTELDSALAAYRAASDVGRSDPAVHLGVCTTLAWQMNDDLRRGVPPEPRYREAVAACDRALAADEDLAPAWYQKQRAHHLWGRWLMNNGRDPRPALDDAEEAAAAVIARDGRFSDAHMQWGNSLRVRGSYEAKQGRDPRVPFLRAIAQLEVAVALDPTSYVAVNDLAVAQVMLGEWEGHHGIDPRAHLDLSIAGYERAEKLDPTLTSATENIAGVLGVKGAWEVEHQLDPRPELQRAAAMLEELSKRDQDADVFDNIGHLYYDEAAWLTRHGADPLPDLGKSAAALHRAIELKPTHAAAHNNLARTEYDRARALSARGADAGAALAAARASAARAIALDANDLAFRDVAVRIEILAGDLPAAERQLKLSLDKPGYDQLAAAEAELRRLRAEKLVAAGRPAAAEIAAGLQACDRAARNDPDDPDIAATRKALISLGKAR